jgi:glycosyltransferase involved in cell wall biosynthesis
VLTLDPDLVPAAVLRRLLRRGVTVVDVHEDYAAVLQDRAWAHGVVGLGGRAVAAAGSTLARHADLTVVADDYLPPLQARHRLVVRNLPDLSALPAAGARDPRPRALYVGDVRASRGLRTMLDAIEAAPQWTLDVVGPVAAGDQDWLEGWTRRSPGVDRVRMHGRLGPQEAWAFAEGAWVGLMLLEETPAFVETIPTKVYEYLACGLAVLATPLPRAAELLRTSGAGRVVRDAREVAAALNDWSDHPDSLDRYRTAARAWSAQNLAGASPYDELADAVAALLPAATG